jgi:protein tyrosine phosphatase domain-containing protein 1
LQEPGEHPYCGDGIHKSSGLSYLPEEFYERTSDLIKDGINFYNFGWEDHKTTNFDILLRILKSIEFCLKEGKKVAVHCHAGRGRTALVICCYMVYAMNCTADSAIKTFKEKRHGSSLSQRTQRGTIRNFEKCKSSSYS